MIPKICLTAAGILIHEQKVLLVKHKKLGIWLNPGGHIEENELPHNAAEREFFEETGVRVAAVNTFAKRETHSDDTSFYVANPILTNVHWVCKENFDERERAGEDYTRQKVWQRGCEQHCNFLYLVAPVAGVSLTEDTTETDGIGWFERTEIAALPTKENIRFEIEYVFSHLVQ